MRFSKWIWEKSESGRELITTIIIDAFVVIIILCVLYFVEWFDSKLHIGEEDSTFVNKIINAFHLAALICLYIWLIKDILGNILKNIDDLSLKITEIKNKYSKKND